MSAFAPICESFCQQQETCNPKNTVPTCVQDCITTLDKRNRPDLVYYTCLAGPGKSAKDADTCYSTDSFCRNMAFLDEACCTK